MTRTLVPADTERACAGGNRPRLTAVFKRAFDELPADLDCAAVTSLSATSLGLRLLKNADAILHVMHEGVQR